MNYPKIYVGTYAKYNAGSITGEWLDLSDYSDITEFYEACKDLHNDESDPEYMFQDYENIPAAFISESWVSPKFWDYLTAMEDCDNKEAFEAFVSNFGYDLEAEDTSELIDRFNDAFCGEQSPSDFTYDIVQEMTPQDAPDFLTSYFDYDKFERDLFMTDYTEVNGFIFRNI